MGRLVRAYMACSVIIVHRVIVPRHPSIRAESGREAEPVGIVCATLSRGWHIGGFFNFPDIASDRKVKIRAVRLGIPKVIVDVIIRFRSTHVCLTYRPIVHACGIAGPLASIGSWRSAIPCRGSTQGRSAIYGIARTSVEIDGIRRKVRTCTTIGSSVIATGTSSTPQLRRQDTRSKCAEGASGSVEQSCYGGVR